MNDRCSIKVIAVLILCIISLLTQSSVYAMPEITQTMIEEGGIERVAPNLPLDDVSWGNNISGTTAKKAVRKGMSLYMEDMGLDPTAQCNGTVSDSFSWVSSNPSVATVNAATGKVTALTEGITNIVGTSPFSSGQSTLTLVLYVIDNELYELSMVALWGDTFFHNTGFGNVGDAMAELNLDSEVIRTYGGEVPVARMTVDMFAKYIETSRIFYFRGHGTRTAVEIDINQNSTTWFTMSFIEPLPANIFSCCELVMYDACLTAEGGQHANNLVTATNAHGAETVVGFETTVVNSEMDYWDEYFFGELAAGRTVEQACAYAMTQIRELGLGSLLNGDGILGSSTYVIAGNKYNTIEPYEED